MGELFLLGAQAAYLTSNVCHDDCRGKSKYLCLTMIIKLTRPKPTKLKPCVMASDLASSTISMGQYSDSYAILAVLIYSIQS